MLHLWQEWMSSQSAGLQTACNGLSNSGICHLYVTFGVSQNYDCSIPCQYWAIMPAGDCKRLDRGETLLTSSAS